MPSVVVVGATGFTGALAAHLLWRHPAFDLTAVTARSETGRRLDEVYPRYRVPLELEALDLERHGEVDAAIVAYPHGAAAETVAQLRERDTRVVDLSADFRLTDPGVYAEWYGDHGAPGAFGDGVYGLPELEREAIEGADLVANPGCFPTAALLALAPLARQGVIDDVVIDAKTGVSGSGRAATDATHFVSVDENVTPYKIGAHRHTPEIVQELGRLGSDGSVTFVPHLVPVDQGELVSCYVSLGEPLDGNELRFLFGEAYANEPFVEMTDSAPGMRDVRDTNLCRIHVAQSGGKALVFAAIDNLWKGASSQAVQNLNLMFGRPEGEGIS